MQINGVQVEMIEWRVHVILERDIEIDCDDVESQAWSDICSRDYNQVMEIGRRRVLLADP